MTSYAWRQLVIFDLETTGLDVSTDRIISISATIQNPVLSKEVSFNALIDPGVLIPASATAIHKISDCDVAESDSFKKVGKRFLEWVYEHAGPEPILCAYNGQNYDLPLLFAELKRHLTPEDCPNFNKTLCVDPYIIAKQVIKNFQIRNYKQVSIYEFLFGQRFADIHSSQGDVLALKRIVNHDLFKDVLFNDVKQLKNFKKYVAG